MTGTENPRVPLKFVSTPSTRHAVNAPPLLIASSHTTHYTCCSCGTVLIHAEVGQVHNLLIHCSVCGSYNEIDEA
jgi:transcription elongation factor Elf1